MGVRSDYLGPILYLNDMVWGVWIGTGLIKNYELKIKNWKKVVSFENLLIGIFVVLNVLVAGNRWVAAYRWLRIGQWLISFKLIKLKVNKVKVWLVWIIPCWIGVESLLGLAQIVKGGSLQGMWYWLGERRFTIMTIGVAQMSVFNEGLIRAYGTFSHPNSMAGFLLVGLLLWKRFSKNRNVAYWIVSWLAVVGIIISGSRTVWGLLVLVTIFNLQTSIFKLKKFVGYGLVGVGVFILILGIIGMNYRTSDFVGGWDTDSLAKRVSLNVVAFKMWQDNFMLGVGAGNFVAKLPEYQHDSQFYWLQPVHNIFLLAGTEWGMLGIIIVIKFLISNVQIHPLRLLSEHPPLTRLPDGQARRVRHIISSWIILGVIVVTGMVDHYWLTLPQNFALLSVVLGVI